MAGRGEGGGRASFGGIEKAANSAGGAVEGGGVSERGFPPVSRQQGWTSSHSASQREGNNQITSTWQQRKGNKQYTPSWQQREGNNQLTSSGQQREGSNQLTSFGQQREGNDQLTSSGQQREGSNRFTPSGQQRGGQGNYNAGEGRPGHENESGSSTGRERRNMDRIEALGRCMTGILRHQAANYNLDMQNDGYVLVSHLLNLRKKTAAGFPLSSHSEAEVLKAVEDDSKQRFGIKNENGVLYIRAVQGHTIKTVESEHLLRSIADPSEVPVCVHGTSEKAWQDIQKEGLKPMTRNHIHFATGLPKEDGVISGMRVTSQIRIYLDVEKAIADEIKLYISENKVVLTEGINGGIAPKYFKKVTKLQADGTETELKLPHDEPVANITAEPKAEPQRTRIKKLPKNSECVFCTNEKDMKTFWEDGLRVSKVSTDKFIHFATAVPTVESSTRGAGKKVPNPVFIHLNVDKAVEAGMELYLQGKEVVTEGTDGVISSDFFKRVHEKRPSGTVIVLQPPHRAKPRNNATDA